MNFAWVLRVNSRKSLQPANHARSLYKPMQITTNTTSHSKNHLRNKKAISGERKNNETLCMQPLRRKVVSNTGARSFPSRPRTHDPRKKDIENTKLSSSNLAIEVTELHKRILKMRSIQRPTLHLKSPNFKRILKIQNSQFPTLQSMPVIPKRY